VDIHINVTHPADRQGYVAQLWAEDELLAEVAEENGDLVVEIIAEAPWKLPHGQLVGALEGAKEQIDARR